MRRIWTTLSTLAIAVVTCATSWSAEPASKQRFDSIVANLDTGGDILVVANLEGCVQNLVTNIARIVEALPQNDRDLNAFRKTFDKVPGFLEKNGFYAVQGFGASVVPRSDGMNDVKVFLARDQAAVGSPLWRSFVGGQPRNLKCQGFLPANTVLARTCTGEPDQLWKLIRAGVAEFASREGMAAFDRQLSNLSTNMGVNIDKVMASLGNEGFFSLQLSQDNMIKIPSGRETPVQMPCPYLLICIAVKDGTLLKAIEQPLASVKMPIVTTQCESTTVSSVNLPLPLPFPFQPSYAMYGNYFLLGSSPAVVSDAIKAFKANNGLVATAEFKKAFAGMPAENNGIFYMSPRFMKTISDLIEATMDSQGNRQGSEAGSAMNAALGLNRHMQSAFVIRNIPSGVLLSGVTSSSGKGLASTMLVAPAGILAGIAIPSFMKAKTQSSHNACINNLRQIDAAKEQWALEQRKQNGDKADIAGISQYIKGGRIPSCPQGGTYTINAIGVNPECSIPGHRLMEP